MFACLFLLTLQLASMSYNVGGCIVRIHILRKQFEGGRGAGLV